MWLSRAARTTSGSSATSSPARESIRRVGGTGDYGADLLVATATGTAVIQCKFYSHPVGYDAVKEAYTSKAIFESTSAYVVSNAVLTTQARRAARQLGVTLAHHARITRLLQSA